MAKNGVIGYMKTGLKVLGLVIVIGLLNSAVSWFVNLLFGPHTTELIMSGSWATVIPALLTYLILVVGLTLYGGGFLAQKFWKWN